ncbi:MULTISPECIES: glycosyltransferase family 4 protein [Pseudoalteromonas]|uniref:glycosyltransferase family 4 protein n=1 Tax=Pseudoalteromonas TaxID=53246 RepID=UPI000F7B0E83|nr:MULTISPECIES: glycosyltransferase family 4 protein [Pseudoalteromonas]MCG7562503.1 glycosyltransferase family 4 protein [Pseudoalteromonas sp. McH1-42]MEC4089941.1 glycosyltransferase family 4 protein [Pseudoalteromonas rubra]
MNVLHMRSEYLDNGPGTQPLKIALQFRERGYESYFAGAKGYMDDIIKENGFEFIEVPSLARLERGIGSFFKSVSHIKNIIKDNNINVVHTHNGACSFIAYFASLLAGRKVTIVRSVRGIELRPSHQYRNWIYKIYPAKLLAVCEFARKELIRVGADPKKISVTFNGADLNIFDKNSLSKEKVRAEYNIKPSDFLIGHVGAFSGWKGQDVLVRVLAKLLEKDSKYKLMLVGHGADFERVQALADELNVAEHVVFVGRVMKSETYHMAFDLYTQPSVKGELFPNAIVEAMALGKTWIGSDISGLKELTNDGKAGKVFEPNDIDSLVSEIEYLSNNPSMMRERESNAYNFVLEQLTSEKVCDRIEKAYREDG